MRHEGFATTLLLSVVAVFVGATGCNGDRAGSVAQGDQRHDRRRQRQRADDPPGHGHRLGVRARGVAPRSFGLDVLLKEEDVQRSVGAGFAVHLVKPFDPGHLIQAIERVAATNGS